MFGVGLKKGSGLKTQVSGFGRLRLRIRVSGVGSGFRVSDPGLGFGIGFRISGFGWSATLIAYPTDAASPDSVCPLVSGLGIWVSGFGFRVSGFGFRNSGFAIQDSGFGIRVSCFAFRVSFQGFGYRIREARESCKCVYGSGCSVVVWRLLFFISPGPAVE